MVKSGFSTRKVVVAAMMTAFVVVFQLLATFTTFFGPFSTAVALVPIVIGSALCGIGTGAWLGLVFGIVVLASGGATLFMVYNIPGTLITVLLKGAACGAAAGLAYHLLERFNRYLAVLVAAIVCPVVNTGVFLLGGIIFFLKDADAIAASLHLGVTGMDVFWVLAMGNFLFELGMNIVISPVTLKILNLGKKKA